MRSTLALTLAMPLVFALACSSTDKNQGAFGEGTKQWQAGQDERAIETYGRGLKAEPEHHQMRLNLARIHYEHGEQHHLVQRRLLSEADEVEKSGDVKRSIQLRSEAKKKRGEAALHYSAANQHLERLVKVDEPEVVAHAAYLRMRTAIFFEDYARAHDAIKTAIEKGQLTGTRRAKFEEFARKLNSLARRPLIPKSDG